MVRSIVLRISAASAVALTAWAMVVATGSSATATQGQPVIAGQTNMETNETVVENANVIASCGSASFDGFLGCGATGVTGSGSMIGVEGFGGNTGVDGSGGSYGVTGSGSTT